MFLWCFPIRFVNSFIGCSVKHMQSVTYGFENLKNRINLPSNAVCPADKYIVRDNKNNINFDILINF